MPKQKKWTEKAETIATDIHGNLLEIATTLNKGQRQQLAKNASIVEFFRFFSIDLKEGKEITDD